MRPVMAMRALTAALLLAGGAAGERLVIDFESPDLGASAFYYGRDGAGGFLSGDAWFVNQFTPSGSPPFFGVWSGWSLSRDNDTTTPGFTNQFSAFPGAGAGGSSQYAVAFSGYDVDASIPNSNPNLRRAAPDVTLPAGALPASVQITNTTYTALSLIGGDGFATAFGDPADGLDDFYRVTVHALDSGGVSLAAATFSLAEHTHDGLDNDFVVDQWTEVDLTPLRVEGVAGLSFRIASSDAGPFGINTPAYVAIDNLTLDLPVVNTGDYNGDGRIDAADYAAWRNAFGRTVDTPGGGADGDGSGRIDRADYIFWRQRYADSLSAGSGAAQPAPEPGVVGWLLPACLIAARRRLA